jgi:ferredoxin-NADP reductase
VPGQFIQVHFNYPDGTATKRSYSLATIHDHALRPGEAVEIAVSYVPGGAATALFTRSTKASRSRPAGPTAASCLGPATATRATC